MQPEIICCGPTPWLIAGEVIKPKISFLTSFDLHDSVQHVHKADQMQKGISIKWTHFQLPGRKSSTHELGYMSLCAASQGLIA